MKKILIALPLFFCVAGCAVPKPEDFTQDKALYEHALSLYEDRQYLDAIDFFESLRNRFPRSGYAIDSELKIADAYFERGDYAEAEISYGSFRSLHPTHAKIPYVVFRIGISHFERIPGGVDRDQTQTKKAVQTFEELVARWPRSEEAEKAQTYLTKGNRLLAERELYVADFYLKKDEYAAALLRLNTVRNTSEEHRAEASYKLALAHYKLKNHKIARELAAEVAKDEKAGSYQGKAEKLLSRLDPKSN